MNDIVGNTGSQPGPVTAVPTEGNAPQPQVQTQPAPQPQAQPEPQAAPQPAPQQITPYPHPQGQDRSQEGVLGDYKQGILDAPATAYQPAQPQPEASPWRIQDGKAYFDQAPQKIRNEDGSVNLDKLYSWTKGAEDYINNHHRPYEPQTFGQQVTQYMPNATEQDVQGFADYFNQHKIPPHAVAPVMEMLGEATSQMTQFYEYASQYIPNAEQTQQGVEWLRSQYGSDYDTMTLTVKNALANEDQALFNAVTHNPALIDFIYRNIKDVAPITDPETAPIARDPESREAVENEIDALDEQIENAETAAKAEELRNKQAKLYGKLTQIYESEGSSFQYGAV